MKTKNLICIMTTAVMFCGVSFGVFSGDNFEEYADSTALNAKWTDAWGSGMVRTLETNVVMNSTKAMKLEYNCGADPYAGLSKYTFSPSEDFSAKPAIVIYYKGLGEANSGEKLVFELKDSNYTKIGEANVENATQAADWTKWEIDISGFSGGNGLSDVAEMVLGPAAVSYGSGTMYFDDIVVVPEPVSAILFVAIGLLAFRRNR